jgi:hypothetical protein
MYPAVYKAKLVVYKGKYGVLLFFKGREDARRGYVYLTSS